MPHACGVSYARINDHEEDTSMTNFDTNGDGYYETVQFDSNYDGYQDTVAQDTNNDGFYDTMYTDTDGDGFANVVMVDANADGYFEQLYIDQNIDGVMESYAIDQDGDRVFETTFFDANADQIDDRVAGHVAVVGPVTNPDPLYNLMLLLAEETGTPVYAPSNRDGDMYSDDEDRHPGDPLRH